VRRVEETSVVRLRLWPALELLQELVQYTQFADLIARRRELADRATRTAQPVRTARS
jgi:hypothetical protein